MSSSLLATGWRHSVADWCGGVSACCKPQDRCGQWMAA